MAQVLLSLGSSIEREKNIGCCMQVLRAEFAQVESSIVYESESVGFKGRHFFNSVVLLHTGLSVKALSVRLREIEDEHGRDRTAPKFSARTLDIDILTYDECVGVVDGVVLPRKEILFNAFVLRPLADLVPNKLHPVVKTTYRDLWLGYDQSAQKLWPADYQCG